VFFFDINAQQRLVLWPAFGVQGPPVDWIGWGLGSALGPLSAGPIGSAKLNGFDPEVYLSKVPIQIVEQLN
jgi:hypothetical protein